MPATAVPGGAPGSAADLLSVKGLTCELATQAGPVRPVEDVSFVLGHGKTLGLVGESGAGKSMLARAILGLVPRNARLSGEVLLNGTNIVGLPVREPREIPGAGIRLVFQDPTITLHT